MNTTERVPAEAEVTTDRADRDPREEAEVKSDVQPKGEWKLTIEEFSFAGCHYNSSCD